MNKSGTGVLGRNILGNLNSSSRGTSNINIPLSLRKCASNGFLTPDDAEDRDECNSVSQRDNEDFNKSSNSKRLSTLGKSPNKFKYNLFSEDKSYKENDE